MKPQIPDQPAKSASQTPPIPGALAKDYPRKKWYAVAYLASDAFSVLGNSLIGVVLPVLIIMRLGSPTWAGIVAVTTTAAQVCAGLMGGVVADRVNRRRLSILADVLSVTSVAALFVIDLSGLTSAAWFIALGLLGAFADMPGQAARQALGPQVADAAGVRYESISGFFQMFQGVAIAIGPALAGIFLLLPNPAWALLITALCSISAAIVTWILPNRIGDYDRQSKEEGFYEHTVAALRLIRTNPLLRFLVVFAAASNVLYAVSANFVLPAFFTTRNQPDQVAWVLATLGVGMIIGGASYGVVSKRYARHTVFLAGLVGGCLGAWLLLSLVNLALIFLGAFLLGVTAALMTATVMVRVMEILPESGRGAVMGIIATLLLTAFPFGFGIATVIFSLVGLRAVTVVLAVGYLLMLGGTVLSPHVRDLDSPED